MVTIRDYAGQRGVTYEAVRQQIKRYRPELEGHIHQEGRTQYLDDAAVAILDNYRAKNPVVVYEKGREDRIKELEAALDEYKTRLISVQEQLLQMGDMRVQLQAAETRQLLLEESREEFKARAAAAEQEAAAAKAELDDARAELNRLKNRSFWQRVFGKEG